LIFLDQDNVAHQKLVENHLREQDNNDIVLGYYAGYGNKKFHYDIKKLKKSVMENKVIKPILKEFREQIFSNPKRYKNEEWKYFVSANFSIKNKIFARYLFDEKIIKWGGQDIELGYRFVKDNIAVLFSKKCLTYNSSTTKMLNKNKFISSMEILKYIYEKHGDDKLKKYCFERFLHTPLSIRQGYKLTTKGNKIIFKQE